MSLNAMVIEDEQPVRDFVREVLEEEGWDVTEAESGEAAFEILPSKNWSLVVCDVNLGGLDGFSVLNKFKNELPQAQVVLITGSGSATGAMNATANGAFDYILKPFGITDLKSLSASVKERLRTVKRDPSDSDSSALSEITLVGRSRAFVSIMKHVGRVAPTSLPVLLSGESGTGKEVVAKALHQRSNRKNGPFVAVNCGAIPAELIESELFGHIKGAFTGADRERIGLLEEANGGTILLDEITETSPAFQVKLLRALQESEVRRVGSNKTQKVDVRVIAASNRDVEGEVEAGRFRKDLFYRLNAVTLFLPPLRERREDIYPLARYFAERAWTFRSPVAFSTEALELLERYDWPGNIRELENAVVGAATLCKNIIRVEDLPLRITNFEPGPVAEKAPKNFESVEDGAMLPLAEFEGRYVAKVLDSTGGNKQQAARILEIDRKRIDRILKRAGF